MLKLGRSKPWEEALGALTGESKGRLDASAMQEYFKPLEDWLAKDNAKHEEYIGWQSGKCDCNVICISRKVLTYI